MLANEIRIGIKFQMLGSSMVNTVLDISDNTERGTVNCPDPDHKAKYSHLITVLENRNQYKPWEMVGVPVTDEWLIMAGFTDADFKNGVFTNPANRHQVVETSGGWIYRVPGLSLRKFYFVHELQNIFFVLTGEEIIFNSGN